MKQVHNDGAFCMVSFGGSTDLPYLLNATSLGIEVATFAIQNNLDGVDFDLENLNVGMF